MFTSRWLVSAVVLGALCSSVLPARADRANDAVNVPALSVAQIVQRNADARGGTQAWHQVQSMAWTGYAVRSADMQRQLPFLLEQQRPQSTRFEIISDGQLAIRASTAKEGWKMRTAPSGKPELLPYSDDELRFAQGAQVIDGPLMDFAARAVPMALTGNDSIDGNPAYVLQIQVSATESDRLWVDAQTFLEARLERNVRNSRGDFSVTSVRYRNYQVFEGLQIPVEVETGSGVPGVFNRLVIERIALNPPIGDQAFARPPTPLLRPASGAIVDTRAAAYSRPLAKP